MTGIGFPKMFKGNSTNIIDDTNSEATNNCLKLLIGSECGTFFGDPQIGVNIKKYIFEQNNYILKDILIDDIYTKIILYIPQIYVERNLIEIDQVKSDIVLKITYKLKSNFKTNTFNLVLFQDKEEE